MSYYILPKNINTINVNPKSSYELCNPYISHSLINYYYLTKQQIIDIFSNDQIENDVSNNSFDYACKIINPYEFVFSKVPGSKYSVSKLKPKTSMFYDLLEISNNLNIFDSFNSTQPIKFLHISPNYIDSIECFEIFRDNYPDEHLYFENVDIDNRLINIFESFEEISKEYKIVFSCHPRTKQKLKKFNILINNSNIIITEPLGFFDFVKLEKNAYMAISDSGTVQEEMCLFKIPTVTIRDTTERPETIWCGSNIVTGLEKANILAGYNRMKVANRDWKIPAEYNQDNVSDVVVNILMSN